MGNGKILTGAIIAGIAIMMTLSAIPAYAGHPSGCPGEPWEEVSAALAPEKDRNGNGIICFNAFVFKFIDDVEHP